MFKLLRYYELYIIQVDACEKLELYHYKNKQRFSDIDINISIHSIHIEQSTCKGVFFDPVFMYYALFFRMLFGFVYQINKAMISNSGSVISFHIFRSALYSSDILLFIIYYLINNSYYLFRFFDSKKTSLCFDRTISLRQKFFNFSTEHFFLLNFVDPEYQNFFNINFIFSQYYDKSIYSDRIILSLFGVPFF